MNQTNCTAQPRIRLADFSLISVTGEDRIRFLQGQLTNDITRLVPGTCMTAGWCSPQGRLLTVMRLFSENDAISLIVSKDQCAALLKRLKMFVMRSKVTLTEDTARALYLSTTPAEGSIHFALSEMSPELAAELGLSENFFLTIDALDESVPEDDALYAAAGIAMGEPRVSAATADKFVPQGINLECVSGISFSKGCYTGQEIVSRVEHIGKTSRRAAVGILEGLEAVAPLTDVVNTEGTVCGTVVYSTVFNNKSAVMVQLSVNELDNPSLTINDRALKLYNLPYAYQRRA